MQELDSKRGEGAYFRRGLIFGVGGGNMVLLYIAILERVAASYL